MVVAIYALGAIALRVWSNVREIAPLRSCGASALRVRSTLRELSCPSRYFNMGTLPRIEETKMLLCMSRCVWFGELLWGMSEGCE